MTASTATVNTASNRMARGAGYGLIAHCFRYPAVAWAEELRDANRWTGWPRMLADSGGDLYPVLNALREAATGLELPDVYLRYVSLFGHTVRGSCPPYELEYGADEIVQRASELADIGGFYNAFGLEMQPTAQERPDHISVECEFMSALLAREAYAMEAGDADQLKICSDAGRKFLSSHLGRWLPAFTRRVRESDGAGFYGRAAGFAAAFVDGECLRLGAAVGSPYLEVRQADAEQETEQSCGLPSLGGGTSAQPLVQLNVDSRPVPS